MKVQGSHILWTQSTPTIWFSGIPPFGEHSNEVLDRVVKIIVYYVECDRVTRLSRLEEFKSAWDSLALDLKTIPVELGLLAQDLQLRILSLGS